MILHLGWLLTTTITSGFFILSLKIFLAKLWYVVPFYFMAIHILKERADTEKLIKYGVFMLALSIVIVLIRHARTGFAFEEANFVVTPIFRNHVNYACIIVVFLPYLWALYAWEKKAGQKLFYAILIGLYITGTYFSYTRAAILSMVLAIIIYFIIKLRWVVPSIMITILVVVTGVSALLYNNNYMRMNPVYERTISHQRFDKLISATYKMEDISTMERVYRWVAGVQMIKDKPLMGFGPGTFYASYGGYTVSSFQTYVSNNPDNSTVHNYYLLTFIEQGLIGFLIFISLCIAVLVIGERTYHRTRDPRDKVIVMAGMLSFCIILLLNTINDMIETDKVGPFFFLSMAIISIYHYKSKSTAESGLPERQ
ncbi:MAG: O-antigen ligase family protein [Saprospiraceae bacterium]|nr:O-antigen ligase family protein [Saprospiraceae bacterium]